MDICNILRIKYIEKCPLLCPSIATVAKQDRFPYITDNVILTKKDPARDLYIILKKVYRNTATLDDAPSGTSTARTLAL